MRKNLLCLFFWVWVPSPQTDLFGSIHLPAKSMISFFFPAGWFSVPCMYFHYPLFTRRAVWLFPFPSSCDYGNNERNWANIDGGRRWALWAHTSRSGTPSLTADLLLALISIVAAPACVSAVSTSGFPFPILPRARVLIVWLTFAILTGVKWNLKMALISSSLISREDEHFWGIS